MNVLSNCWESAKQRNLNHGLADQFADFIRSNLASFRLCLWSTVKKYELFATRHSLKRLGEFLIQSPLPSGIIQTISEEETSQWLISFIHRHRSTCGGASVPGDDANKHTKQPGLINDTNVYIFFQVNYKEEDFEFKFISNWVHSEVMAIITQQGGKDKSYNNRFSRSEVRRLKRLKALQVLLHIVLKFDIERAKCHKFGHEFECANILRWTFWPTADRFLNIDLRWFLTGLRHFQINKRKFY